MLLLLAYNRNGADVDKPNLRDVVPNIDVKSEREEQEAWNDFVYKDFDKDYNNSKTGWIWAAIGFFLLVASMTWVFFGKLFY